MTYKQHINLYKLFHKQQVNTRRFYTLQQAIDRFNNELPVQGQEPTDIVLHVGTNKLDHDSPQEIVRLMNEFVQCVKNKFPKATIHISEILPRKTASMNSAANQKNSLLQEQMEHQSNIKLIKHQFIEAGQLVDERHLAYWYDKEDTKSMSGTMWLSGDIFESIFGFKPSQRTLLFARLRNSDIYP